MSRSTVGAAEHALTPGFCRYDRNAGLIRK
jgi:hypothetical protein